MFRVDGVFGLCSVCLLTVTLSRRGVRGESNLSLIHISEPTRRTPISYAVFCMVWAGKGAVKTGRKMLGETNPADSLPGSIRGDFCIDIGRNICHGSDTVENAEKEIALWFPEGTNAWTSHSQSWIYE